MVSNKYVVYKYVLAKNLKEALAKEPTTPVQEIWLDKDYEDEKKQVRIKGFHA